MPSSPMRTLPRPSTSVFTGSFVTLLPVKLPSTYDRRNGSAALDVVVIESKIYVHDNKGNEEPKKHVVPEAHAELPAEQRHNPDDHARKPRVAHAGVERKAGDGLRYECEEREEIDKCCKRIVTGGDFPVHLGLQNVGLDDVHNFPLLLLCYREKVIPLGVLVADEAPIDPRRKIEHIDKCGQEVQEPHPSEPVLLISFCCVESAQRGPNQVTGDAEYHEGHRVDPVIGANRQLPYINPPVLHRLSNLVRKAIARDCARSTHSPHSKETW